MTYSQVEKTILERYQEKMHSAGGPRTGFVLRKRAICSRPLVEASGLDWDGGLAGLVDKGLLSANEAGDFYFLTEEGVEAVRGL